MSAPLTRKGRRRLLQVLLGQTPPESFVVRLYVNDPTGEEPYEEAHGFGYSPHVLAPSRWTLTEDEGVLAATVAELWQFTGRLGPVYGYLVEGSQSKLQYRAERFAGAPYDVRTPKDEILVLVKLVFMGG